MRHLSITCVFQYHVRVLVYFVQVVMSKALKSDLNRNVSTAVVPESNNKDLRAYLK